MMRVQIDICDEESGAWYRRIVLATGQQVEQCYALPKDKCRAEHFGLAVTPYRALIWQVAPEGSS